MQAETRALRQGLIEMRQGMDGVLLKCGCGVNGETPRFVAGGFPAQAGEGGLHLCLGCGLPAADLRPMLEYGGHGGEIRFQAG